MYKVAPKFMFENKTLGNTSSYERDKSHVAHIISILFDCRWMQQFRERQH